MNVIDFPQPPDGIFHSDLRAHPDYDRNRVNVNLGDLLRKLYRFGDCPITFQKYPSSCLAQTTDLSAQDLFNMLEAQRESMISDILEYEQELLDDDPDMAQTCVEEHVFSLIALALASFQLIAMSVEAFERIVDADRQREVHQTWAELLSVISCEMSLADERTSGGASIAALKAGSILVERLSAAINPPSRPKGDDL